MRLSEEVGIWWHKNKAISEVPVLGLVAKCSVNMVRPSACGVNNGQEVRSCKDVPDGEGAKAGPSGYKCMARDEG